MSVAIYIAVQSEIEGFDPFVNGKAIGRAGEKTLEKICKAAGVRSIYEFISQNAEEFAEFLEEFDEFTDEFGGETPQLPEEMWFSPDEGLVFVNSLVGYLESNPKAFRGSEAYLEDLIEYRSVFERLVKEGVCWHFSVDV